MFFTNTPLILIAVVADRIYIGRLIDIADEKTRLVSKLCTHHRHKRRPLNDKIRAVCTLCDTGDTLP